MLYGGVETWGWAHWENWHTNTEFLCLPVRPVSNISWKSGKNRLETQGVQQHSYPKWLENLKIWAYMDGLNTVASSQRTFCKGTGMERRKTVAENMLRKPESLRFPHGWNKLETRWKPKPNQVKECFATASSEYLVSILPLWRRWDAVEYTCIL